MTDKLIERLSFDVIEKGNGTCTGCYFEVSPTCEIFKCMPHERDDGKSVIFKLVEGSRYLIQEEIQCQS